MSRAHECKHGRHLCSECDADYIAMTPTLPADAMEAATPFFQLEKNRQQLARAFDTFAEKRAAEARRGERERILQRIETIAQGADAAGMKDRAKTCRDIASGLRTVFGRALAEQQP